MREPPAGVVTLLFTDVEGSTRLLEELGPSRYRDALAEHRRALRDAFRRHGGYEVDYEGDAFFVAFQDAGAAVAAASEGQAALSDGSIRVRMGLHTGEPLLDPPKYIGRDVHLAARIMSAAHGGQVVLSRATREFVEDDVLDLGEHRLKDFAEPVWLYQLGEERFPPLKTISNTNLPRPASSFVGREREVAEVVALVRKGARLVTLTGPGGSGKTRLAIEAAAALVPAFKAGVFWVGLAAIRDPALVLETAAQTLGAKEELAFHIGECELLLVLDNFEQVIDAAPELATLVERCPNFVLLVTSRELLRVRGEVEYQVLPLAAPEAVRLFCERASVAPAAAVEELCLRLDSMPLAVELAAARAGVLTPEQILERLSERLDLFRGGRDADPRQQTLRTTIGWSHDLLTPEEQALFARLAVFVGGCTLEAAEQVADADLDTLQSLVDKSLLRSTNGRFWMLETIREYAAERLEESDDAAIVRRRRADWIVGWGSGFDLRRGDQADRLRHLRDELANVRAALDELAAGDRACDRLQLVASLAQGMFYLGATRESREWLEGALQGGASCAPGMRARALAYLSLQASLTGDADRGGRYAAEATRLIAGSEDGELRADVITAASVAQMQLGNLDQAEQLALEAIACAEDLGDAARAGDARSNLSYMALCTGNLDRARRTAEEELPGAQERGNHGLAAALLHNLFLVELKSGDLDAASRQLARLLELCRRHSFDSVARLAVEGAAAIAVRRNAPDEAATLLGAASVAATGSEAGPVEDEVRREAEGEARSTLGDSAFVELSSAGSRLGLEEAAHRAARWLERFGAAVDAAP